jgi:phosphoenolpyruvate carboxykinase (GTP)
LKYIFGRCEGQGATVDTFIGKVPAVGSIDTTGLNLTDAEMAKALEVKAEDWKNEVALIEEHYARFGNHLPAELQAELDGLKKRIGM